MAEARVLEPHVTRAPDAPSSTRFPFPQYTAYDGASDLEYDELDLRRLQSLRGGESRSGQLTGTKALMLAIRDERICLTLPNAELATPDHLVDLSVPPTQVVCGRAGHRQSRGSNLCARGSRCEGRHHDERDTSDGQE
jgi:hypothetical protein